MAPRRNQGPEGKPIIMTMTRAGAARRAATNKARQGMKSVRGQAQGWRVHNMQNGEEVLAEDGAEESIAGEIRAVKES